MYQTVSSYAVVCAHLKSVVVALIFDVEITKINSKSLFVLKPIHTSTALGQSQIRPNLFTKLGFRPKINSTKYSVECMVPKILSNFRQYIFSICFSFSPLDWIYLHDYYSWLGWKNYSKIASRPINSEKKLYRVGRK